MPKQSKKKTVLSYPNIPYKSYCWSLGTTSFRAKVFNAKIEWQLKLLTTFWALPENTAKNWDNHTQAIYYDFLKEQGFLDGIITDKSKKAKDARQKTSGLRDIGLIYETRRLTPVGESLLRFSEAKDFSSDNAFNIDKDSFIYLKQLLKTSYSIKDDVHVRPFLILLHILSTIGDLSHDEFQYLAQLCVDTHSTALILKSIPQIRAKKVSIDDVIIKILLNMPNYKEAQEIFFANTVTNDLICTIGINRKSRMYDKVYFPLYKALKDVFLHNKNSVDKIFESLETITIGHFWKKLLFKDTSIRKIKVKQRACLHETKFSDIKTERELKAIFFEYLHLFKAKATLVDYADLNKRYIKNTGIILFEDRTVKLDVVPKHFFASVEKELYSYAYTQDLNLENDIPLIEIAPCLIIKEEAVINAVNAELGINISTTTEAKQAIEDERYKRVNKLIETKFTDTVLTELLDLFKSRKDKRIMELVTDNADIPTIFEYILGIIWYKISNKQGKLLDYMKLSLEADLLPKTHAGGGEADIVYEYEASEAYPKHSLLLEATLSNANSQRSMEMEPVSRHLGQHLLKTDNQASYCIFATTFLNINVISDFRSRKTTPWYDTNDYSKSINGMKIIPLETEELKSILAKGIKYPFLYKLFEDAYQSDLQPHEWYETFAKNI